MVTSLISRAVVWPSDVVFVASYPEHMKPKEAKQKVAQSIISIIQLKVKGHWDHRE